MILKKITAFISSAVIAAASGFCTIYGGNYAGVNFKDNTDTEKVIVTLDMPSIAEGGNKKDIEFSAKKAESYIKELYPDFEKEYTYENLVSGFSGEIPQGMQGELEKYPYIKTVEKCGRFTKASDKEGKEETLSAKSEETEFTGKGKVIAVLDSELDINHKMFSGENFPDPALSQKDIINIENSGKLNARADEKAYVSAKLPFVYSYTDEKNPYNVSMSDSSGMHGTHVCGIAAGNRVSAEKGEVSGTAPDAQLIFMDVFRCDKNADVYISDDAMVVAALEDAVTLGADAINLSFGEDTELTEGSAYKKACENAAKSGVAIFAAAGNNSEEMYSARNPDNSTILSPSSVTGVISAASCGEDGISTFSSKGVSESLELKPDITAPGEDVYSSYFGGKYKSLSGTSMSSPALAGNYLVLSQRLEKKFPDKSKQEIMTLTQNIMMNSAEILTDYENKNLPYSPRFQGAGKVNLKNAENCNLIVTGIEGDAKVNLYDKLSDTFEIPLNFNNISGKSLDFEKAEITIITDDTTDELSDSENVISGSREIEFSADLSDLKKISAGENSTKTIKVSLDKNQVKEISSEFSNGFFVEGFVSLSNEKNGSCCDISVPFMGFYGDWGKVPIFSTDSHTKEQTGCSNQVVTNYGDDITSLGENNIDGSGASGLYISPNGDNKADTIGFDMNNLRESVFTTLEVYDKSKKMYYEEYTKCVNRGYTGSQFIVDSLKNLKDGKEYRLKLSGKINYKGAESQSIYVNFRVDKTPPKVEYSKIYNKNGRKIIEIKFSDESRLDGVCILGKGKGKFLDCPDENAGTNYFSKIALITNVYSENYLNKTDYNFGNILANRKGRTMTVRYDITDMKSYEITASDGAMNTVKVKSEKPQKDSGDDSPGEKPSGTTNPDNDNGGKNSITHSAGTENPSTGTAENTGLVLCAVSLLLAIVSKTFRK